MFFSGTYLLSIASTNPHHFFQMSLTLQDMPVGIAMHWRVTGTRRNRIWNSASRYGSKVWWIG